MIRLIKLISRFFRADQEDGEVLAMSLVTIAFAPLSEDGRRRVHAYIWSRWIAKDFLLSSLGTTAITKES